jgi:hypothetical protein
MLEKLSPFMPGAKRLLRRLGKIILWLFVGYLSLMIILIALVQSPVVQNKIKEKVILGLAQKLGTRVEVGNFRLTLRGSVEINHIFIADDRKDTLFKLDKLLVSVNPFALLKKRVIFSSISPTNLRFRYAIRDTAGASNIDFIIKAFADTAPKTAQKEKSPWQIEVKKINLTNLKLRMDNAADSSQMNFHAGQLYIRLTETDLANMKFIVSSVSLGNAQIQSLTYKKAQTILVAKNEKKQSTSGNIQTTIWHISLKDVSYMQLDSISRTGSSYYLGDATITPDKIDIPNKTISLNLLDARHIFISMTMEHAKKENSVPQKETIKQEPSWAIFLKKGSIGIDSLHVVNNNADATDSLPYLSDISLSKIFMEFSASYQSPVSWKTNITQFVFTDNRTSLQTSVVLDAESNKQQILIRQLNFQTGTSQLIANGSAHMAEMPKGQIPDFQLKVQTFHLTSKDVLPYLPTTAAFRRFQFPGRLSFSGDFSSKQQQVKGQGRLISDLGNVNFLVHYKKSIPEAESEYDLQTEILKLELGHLLNDSLLGSVTAHLHVNGKGLNPDSLTARLNFHIDSVSLAAKTYRNIDLNGSLAEGTIAATTGMTVPEAKLKISLKGQFKNKQPDINVSANILHLDFKAMGLMKDTLTISGRVNASYKNKGPQNMQAYTDTCNISLFTSRKQIDTHTKLSFIQRNDTVRAMVNSDFGDLAYTSNIPLGKTAILLRQYFGKYYSLRVDTPSLTDNQFFRFTLSVRDLSGIGEFLPNNITIPEGGEMTSEIVKQKFKTVVNFNKLAFNQLQIDSLRLNAEGGDSSLNIALQMASFQSSIQTLRHIDCRNILKNGQIGMRLKFDNEQGAPWFNIGMSALKKDSLFKISLKEPLILDHDSWNINQANEVAISKKNIVLHNLALTRGEKQITLINAKNKTDGLSLSFRNLGLSFVSELLKNDPNLLTGSFNGDLSVFNLSGEEKTFDAQIKLTNMAAAKQSIGNFTASVSNMASPTTMNVLVNLENKKMNLNLKGQYSMKNDSSLRFNLSMNHLSLASFGPLLDQYMTNTAGEINASLAISGNTAQPLINGNIRFDGVAFQANALQSKFSIDKQQIVFNGDRISFPSFLIKDDSGNPMEINGNVNLNNLKNIAYNVTLSSKKFQLYHVFQNNQLSKESNLLLTSNIKIEGKNSTPVVNAKVEIDEGSKLYYEMARHGGDYSEEGVIEFIGRNNIRKEPPKTSITQNMSLTANVTLADGTPITIVTDPAKGDKLTVVTGGIFSISQRPFQSPRMVGKAMISGGDYTLTLTSFKKNFKILPNSSLNWTGDMTSPEFKLKAYYEIRTSPAPLFTSDQGNTSQYTSALPFRVNLNINGTLSKPELTFEITQPEDYQNSTIASKLQQINSDPSEVNRQAMSLLLFGTFDIASMFSNISYNSVSSLSNSGGTNALLSRALTQFAAHEVRFVDLHFDLQSYDNYGLANSQNVRTELKVDAARKWMNNRLNSKLGATFVLQSDETEQNRNWYDKVTPEFSLDYLLNKPKTWSIRAFRQNEYRGLVEGKVVNTGAGVLFQKDFDNTRELFRNPKEEENGLVAKKEIK